MGGEPRTALNITCFPQQGVPMDVLSEILRGGLAKADEAGVVVLGGHSVNDEEIKFGMAVTGLVHPDRIWRNVGARAGDVLVLTKALGTGILTTAAKHGAAPAPDLAAAVDGMLTLNAAAAHVLRDFTVHACTDVTGFSLLGHGFEMAHGSGVRLVLDAPALPLLPGARALALGGQLTGGCRRNRAWLGERVDVAASVPADLVEIGYDPQTSGGLLAALPEEEGAAAVEALRAAGVGAASIVGRVEARADGSWVALRS
jgi:selenide,water dikinase